MNYNQVPKSMGYMLIYNFETQKDMCCFNCVIGTQSIDVPDQSDTILESPETPETILESDHKLLFSLKLVFHSYCLVLLPKSSHKA